MPSASSDVASTTSSPPEGVERQPVVGLLLGEDVDRGLQPEDVDAAGVARGAERVGALGAVDRDRVGRAVAAAVRPAQVETRLRQVGAAQVADDDVVGTAEGAEVDALDVVEVHRHVGDVADEQDASAVRGDVDVLGDVGAEEEHRVRAVLALERVVAVARVPLEDVVAGAHQGQVVAVVAEDEVVVVAAEEHVGALRAEQLIVAGAAVDRQLDHAGGQRRRGDAVVAAERVDDEASFAPSALVMFTCAASPSTEAEGPGADDVDDVGAVGAVDDDGVGLPVAGRPAERPGQVDVDLATSVPDRSLTIVVSVFPAR